MKFLILSSLLLFHIKTISQDSKWGFSADEIKEACPYLTRQAQNFACYEKDGVKHEKCRQNLPEEPPLPKDSPVIDTVNMQMTFCNSQEIHTCFPKETREECFERRQDAKKCTIDAIKLASKQLCTLSSQ